MDKECSNCTHWDWQGGEFYKEGVGLCKRYPPVLMQNLVTSVELIYDSDKLVNFFTHSLTVDNDTCGEWEYDLITPND